MDDEKEERRGFRVTDRRRFAGSGEPRAEEPGEAPPPAPAAPGGESHGEPAARWPTSDTAAQQGPTPSADEPVSFSTFVLGLSTQALLHLGEIPNPVTKAVEADLGAAKHVIDILGILREKTRNNLEQGEETLLDSILYDLRMRYVELVRRA